MNFDIIYSKRKTTALRVTKDNKIEVRCNGFISKSVIEKFVGEKKNWIKKIQTEIKIAKMDKICLTPELMVDLINKSHKIIPKRVEYYSKLMGIVPSSVKINTAKTKWGSCSGKNSLNFSCRLMLADDETIDYVIIHELAHIKEHNHSCKFWDIVRKYCSEYKKCKQELKKLELRIGDLHAIRV